MKLEEVIPLLQARRFAEAEAALKELLEAAPGRPDLLEMLGIAAASQGRPGEALSWFDRALAVRADSASLRHNRARALSALGRAREAREDLEAAIALNAALLPAWTELGGVLQELGDARGAERAYRKAIELKPSQAEVHYNLGVFLQRAGRAEEAVAAYRRAVALKPAFPAALNNLGNTLRSLGRADEALAQYEQALRVDPNFAEAHSNLGAALRELGRVDEAIPALERALALKPQLVGALNNLGIAYFARHRLDEASECYRRALQIDPRSHEALTNLGNAVAAQGRFEEAESYYRRVIELMPREADAYNNLGLVLQDRGDAAAALASYEQALALDPAHADAITNVGNLLQERGQRDQAMEHYRRAVEANPRFALAAYNMALLHLHRHEFAGGWALLDRRFETQPPLTPPRGLTQPWFTASDWGAGHRLAIWKEQGVGDQIVYATLLPELDARGQEFVFEADRRLVPAFKRAHPGWNIVAAEPSAAAFAGCDRQLAAASLGAFLRPDEASFARQPRAILAADEARAAEFRGRLAGPRIVGISWRSFQPRVRGRIARAKSAPLAAFLPLSRRHGLELLDLQYGDTAAEREAFGQAGGRLSRLEGLDLYQDLDGVLAAIAACDVVVTTSNVTAHLAGSLGKRVLLVYLRGISPFHYWVAGPDGHCLWYPSIEVVSSPAIETWDQALARVHELLDP